MQIRKRRKYHIGITIDEISEDILWRAGAGNVSAGVRQCAKEWGALHPSEGDKAFHELNADGTQDVFTVPGGSIDKDELDDVTGFD